MDEPALHTLVTGRGLLESPRWHDGRLWFADWTAGEILAVDADGSGGAEVVVRHESLPLCFDFLPDGAPLLVSGPALALLRLLPDGSTSTYADLSGLSPHPCNDIVIDGRGNVYVNNGNFDFATGPPQGEVAPGFIALVTPDGTAAVVAEDIAFPNGMAVTADGSTLIVADSYRHSLIAFEIAVDGTLSPGRVWAALGDGVPDGICIDADGAVWYADVPHQRCDRVAEGGEVLQRIGIDRGAFACTLGGDDGATLFVVGARWPGAQHLADFADWDGRVLSTPAPAAGAGWPART
jgi:sugar lactone lactonase YvrE